MIIICGRAWHEKNDLYLHNCQYVQTIYITLSIMLVLSIVCQKYNFVIRIPHFLLASVSIKCSDFEPRTNR